MLDPHEPLASYTIERTFPVAPERLFHAFTDEAELKAWIWGADAEVRRARVELEAGGRFHVVVKNPYPDWPHEEVAVRGMVLFVEPPHRLIHTVHWDAHVGYNADGRDPIDEVVAIDIRPEAEGCRLRYTHLGIPDDGVSAAEHERSVRATLDVLARRLADG